MSVVDHTASVFGDRTINTVQSDPWPHTAPDREEESGSITVLHVGRHTNVPALMACVLCENTNEVVCFHQCHGGRRKHVHRLTHDG